MSWKLGPGTTAKSIRGPAGSLDPRRGRRLNRAMALAVGLPLLETKLRPPDRRPGLVPRPGLVARLEEAAGHKLTLVSAPAGWGKTTLVGDWLSRRDGPSGWLAIDPADNDPARFWTYLAEALRRAGAEVDPQALGALAAPGGALDAGLSAIVNAAADLPEPAVVAIDDYHLIGEAGVHASLELLVERLPETLRLVMTTRSDPPMSLGRLRARRELAELRAPDLRFDDAEAEALLEGASGLLLDDLEVERLRLRTEGWAAGLYLAGLSLRGREDVAGFIDDFAGDDRLVVDYLAAEVLEGQPEDRRRFLLRTSILGRLSGDLCDAVALTDGSARRLADLERSNLFLVPLDSRRRWYRYHHLFGELLQHELWLTAPDEVPELHRRAAAWHREHGAVDDAIRHLAQAGDIAAAADLIAESWQAFHDSGWITTTEGWLALLPEETVRADARLCVARAWTGVSLGRHERAALALEQADAALARAGEAAGPLEPHIAMARSFERLLAGDARAAVAPGRRAVELVGAQEPYWRSPACLALGIALHARGEMDEARPYLEEAAEVGRASGHVVPASVALSHLVEHDIAAGDLDRAERRANESLELTREIRHAEYPHAAGGHSGLALVFALRGDLEAARREADRGVELARRGTAPQEIAYCTLVRGEVLLAAGEREGARAAARDARSILGSSPDPGHLTERLLALEEGVRGAGAQAAPPAAIEALTERELAVLRLLTGLGSAREIASELYVSHNTVKTQIRSIYRKLGVATRAEAVSRARERGLLSRSPVPGGS
jgi:LuxR family maltose regulon positive regulatory protein